MPAKRTLLVGVLAWPYRPVGANNNAPAGPASIPTGAAVEVFSTNPFTTVVRWGNGLYRVPTDYLSAPMTSNV
ncbi:MAG TPA: hypothetical protein VM597_02680 [Gemmataceae bacterium]|nr:hypothetical protein [Gemmataceae bacterium]